MRYILATLALSTLIAVCPTYAAAPALDNGTPGGGLYLTGQRLAELCDGKIGTEQPDTPSGGTCLGYINGVAATLMLYGVICYNNVTYGQVSDTVVKYMNEHPVEIARRPAIILIGIALKAAYPVTAGCRKETGDPRTVP